LLINIIFAYEKDIAGNLGKVGEFGKVSSDLVTELKFLEDEDSRKPPLERIKMFNLVKKIIMRSSV
jgi:hypothetical protein